MKEGISRFKSLRGSGSGGGGSRNRNGNGDWDANGNGNGINRRPSVRERFGSLRRDNNNTTTAGNTMRYNQIATGGGWYGGMGSNTTSKYHALGSSVEVGVY